MKFKLPEDAGDLGSLPAYRQIKNNAFLERVKTAVAFDYVTVTGMDIDGYRLGERRVHIESSVPPALVEAYVAERLYEDDPILQHILATGCAALESVIYLEKKPPARLSQLASDLSVRNRTAFPVLRGDIIVASVCFMRVDPFTDDEVKFLSQISRLVYDSVVGQIVKRFATEQLKLSEGELICLKLASIGLTTVEIADHSRFQAATVDSYIKSATKKLGCRNRTHAIAEGIRRSMI